MKKWFMIETAVVFIVALLGFMGKHSFEDRGIIGIRTLEDVRNLDCNVNQIFTQKDVDLFIEDSINNFENLSEEVNIYIVKPTNSLRQYNFTMVQEVEIVEVIKGNEIQNNTIEIITSGGVYDEKYRYDNYNNQRPIYYGMMNLMYQDHLYLVFLNPLAINSYESTRRYTTSFSLFSILNITSNYSIPITKNITEIHYNDFEKSEFLCDSEYTLNQLLKHKQEIIMNKIK